MTYIDFTQNGLWSSLPHVVSYVGAVASGELADLLRRNKIFSTTVTRKLFQCICAFTFTRIPVYVLVMYYSDAFAYYQRRHCRVTARRTA